MKLSTKLGVMFLATLSPIATSHADSAKSEMSFQNIQGFNLGNFVGNK